MKLSDAIAEFINEMLGQQDMVELQRGRLASQFGCAPSQINYVIETRFSPERGFSVESRRGGGGYIRIARVQATAPQLLMHAVNGVGDSIDQASAQAFVENLYQAGVIGRQAGQMLLAMMGDKSLAAAPQSLRPQLRASLLKAALVSAASSGRPAPTGM